MMPMIRKWFQFHLSTAIALMLVSSMLLWANVRPIRNESYGEFIDVELLRGWPFIVIETYYQDTIDDKGLRVQSNPRIYVDGEALLIDASIAFFILVATWFVVEVMLGRFLQKRSNYTIAPADKLTGDKRESSEGG